MTPFVERFTELGKRETRTVTVAPGQEIPAGEYAFVEMYCNEPGCDCRRVTINVLRADTGWSKVWATISYGWEGVDFYRKWGGAHSDPVEMQGPSLDTLNAQTKYSPILLDLFRKMIQSRDYVERLERHYRMFHKSVDGEPGGANIQEINRIENRRKRLRALNRRGRHPR